VGGGAQEETSQWNREVERQRFIVVYPSGVAGAGPGIWRAERGAGLVEDLRFIAELIDTLKAAYNVDSTSVYANGLSNGGGMTFVLSCRLSDRIPAVGMAAPAPFLPWAGARTNGRCR
jgi:polyhydroxybutyrate depolymerase